MRRLAWLIGRYGGAIERDLHDRGVDLLDLWRGHRLSPRKALNLIDGLPSHSAYREALALDEELAEVDAESDAPAAAYRPRITEWSPTEQLLAAVFDRLGEVVATLVATAGGKPKLPQSWPRPETAMERVTRRRQAREYDDLLALVEQSKRRNPQQTRG